MQFWHECIGSLRILFAFFFFFIPKCPINCHSYFINRGLATRNVPVQPVVNSLQIVLDILDMLTWNYLCFMLVILKPQFLSYSVFARFVTCHTHVLNE